MESMITQLGIGGIFALLVIREVFNYQKSRNSKKQESFVPFVRVAEVPQECHDKLEGIYRMCKELSTVVTETNDFAEQTFKMHDVRNGAGQPVWYTGRLTEAVERQKEAVEALAANVKDQTTATKELLAAVRKLNGDDGS